MPGASYVLDKTFRAYGSIGTFRVVSCDVGTNGYCATLAGTLIPGTIPGVGFTQTGSSKSGDEVEVRLIGISKSILSALQGTNPLGRPMYVRRGGRVSVLHPIGTVAKFAIGVCVGAEGTGSSGQQVDILIQPQFISH